MARLIRFLRGSDAATAVEYAVMLALIIVVVIGAIAVLGGNAGLLWGNSNSDLTSAGLGS
ncbi:MAG TPA: Flp family type IVb pilin [Pirellulales bacterium]|jgi:pilus assembly protein Flp/PilA|nr:Flp family type IVb pilin [Pirellulales bacterium]HEV3025196.1 Flp family type IVb pilin [Pirellulales bacterium]